MKRTIKIKNITYLTLSLLAFPLFVFAAVDHSYPSATSPTHIQITADDYDKDINCGGLRFWGVQVVEHITGGTFAGSPRFVPASILSQEFTIDVPPGDYEEVTFICSDDGDNAAFQLGSIENDLAGDQIIFTAQSAEPASLLDGIGEPLGF